MEPRSPDLEAYFRRIGYAGRASPTLETLAGLHALHVASIPFENVAAFCGEGVRLDVGALEEKLLAPGRGGWCFEHNLLFAHVLRAIGFEVALHSARVRWNVPATVVTPRSHCFLRVTVGGADYLADTGFGGLTLAAPLRMEPGIEQATPHEPHRLVLQDGVHTLEAFVAGEWQALYRFDLAPAHQADYEVSNFYLAHHPESPFVQGLVAARAAPDRRHALRNTRYAVHYPGGRTERREIARPAELRALLRDAFHVELPQTCKVEAKLEALFSDPAAPAKA